MIRTPASEAARRRTFAIISHPDAGKTTLTEHLLLLGGAIHAAGRVKARGEARRAKSDWMKIEQERGISVTTAVMLPLSWFCWVEVPLPVKPRLPVRLVPATGFQPPITGAVSAVLWSFSVCVLAVLLARADAQVIPPHVRVLHYGVPSRRPEVTKGVSGSKGMPFLLQVIAARTSAFSETLPFSAFGRRSTSIR